MGKVITGAQAFFHKWDVSGTLVGMTPERTLEILEYRPFNSAAVKKEAGLFSSMATLTGVMDLAAFEKTAFFDEVGNKRAASIHFAKAAAAEGDISAFWSGWVRHPEAPITQGALLEFQLPIEVDGNTFPGIVFGRLAAIGTKTSSGNTATGIVLPAIAAGQTLCAVLHVTGIPTGTLDVTIESADAGDPTFSSPTTHLTFTQVTTTPTSEVKTKFFAAADTDTLWRAKWASATTPSHPLSVSLGIHH
jgi:hypothetical protein